MTFIDTALVREQMFGYRDVMIDDPASRPLQAALVSARAAIAGLVDQIESVPPQDLAGLLTLVDDLGAAAAGARVAVAAAAVSHGVPAAAGQRTREWLADHAPSLRQGGLAPVAKLADELTGHRGGLSTCGLISADHPLGIVWPDVAQGRVLPALAVGVLDEIDRLTPRLVEAAIPTVTRALVDLGVDAGLSSMRRLRPALLARYGQTGELERVHAALAAHAQLSAPRVESAELTEYRLAMTPEQAAILEAAVGPLSAPQPNPETGERDLRSPGQRRVEALTEICWGVGAGGGSGAGSGGSGPGLAGAGLPSASPTGTTSTRTGAAGTATDAGPRRRFGAGGLPMWGPALHVLVNLTDLSAMLRARVPAADPGHAPPMPADWTGVGARVPTAGGAAAVLGSWATDTLLPPETIRRLACAADLIPHVLGSRGELVDLGRTVRLFTAAQRRALTRRDRRCTYPGCLAPADWTRIHHVLHWLDGGGSDLGNATLLCQRHHTLVHDRRLWATVRDAPDEGGRQVFWDLTPGSYDNQLAQRRAERPARAVTVDAAFRGTDGGRRVRRLATAPEPYPDPHPERPGWVAEMAQAHLEESHAPPDPLDPLAGVDDWEVCRPGDLGIGA